MDFLRLFFERRKRYYRNFPIITLNVGTPVKTLDVNRLTYLTHDYVAKVKLPPAYRLYSFLNPFKHLPGIEPPNPQQEAPNNEQQQAPVLGIPLNNFDEFLANVPMQMQNWIQAQEQAALAAMEPNVAELDLEMNLEAEAAAGPQPEAPAADVEIEAPLEADEAVNVHVQELVEDAVANVVGDYEEAQHYEGAGVAAGAVQAGAGGLVPLEREVGAGDDEVGAAAAEPIEEIEEQPREDAQEPSTSGTSGYSSSGTQAGNNRPDEE